MSDKLEMTKEEKRLWLAEQIAAHEAQAEQHKKAANSHKVELAALLDDFGTVPVGNLKVTYKRPNRKFSTEAFTKAHPFNEEPNYYKIELNTAAIPENIKETYMLPGDGEGSVTVK